MNILIIAGTNRADSMSSKMAEKLSKQYQENGANVDVIDLVDLPSDIFVSSIYKEKPASFQPLQERVLAANGIVFIVPEYNGSFPGILKYFIDLWQYPASFQNRCVSYVGLSAGPWGALRAVEALQGVFGYRNAFQFNERVFVNNIYSRWDFTSGKLKQLSDKEIDLEELLESQTKNFISFCEKHA